MGAMRIIEPFGVGGGPDLLARALAPKLSELWGQPVTVENHPGAGATAGPALVAKSPPDGSTLLINTSAQAYGATLSKNLPYDPLKDFIPVASLTTQSCVLVAGHLAGITTVRELIAAAKMKPG
jgi:tripartite-type tricarboxylate transporter receptor subunit TctC